MIIFFSLSNGDFDAGWKLNRQEVGGPYVDFEKIQKSVKCPQRRFALHA